MAVTGIAIAAGLLSLLYVPNADLQLGLIVGCGILGLASLVMALIRWER